MENRSHALLAGIFTLVLLTAAALVAVWVGRDRTDLQTYDIVSATSVSGLNRQSAVRYQGVPVGRVLSLNLNPDRPGQVRIRIGVAPTTPITQSTWAELGVQGVTGLANVELRDDGVSKTRLYSTPPDIAVIPLRPGLFERIEQRGGTIMSNVEQATHQMERLLSQQNVQALTLALQNTADITQSLKEAQDQLRPVLDKVGPLVESLRSTTQRADRALNEIAGLARDARTALARLDSPDGPLAAATRSVEEISWAAARLTHDTLPAVGGMARDVSAAARGATSALRRVGDAPESLLFGRAPALPGPGEPGFAGFGR